MVKVGDLYIHSYLKKNLDILKKNVVKDWDFWVLVDGREGSGKSTLAMQIGKYLDPGITVDRVVFTPRQFERAVREADKYQAVVWDESVTGTQSTDMTKMARTLKKMAVQMRQKNLFIIMVIHSFFDMNKYYAVHRTWFLLHVYYIPNEETETFQRGRYEFYDFDKKKNMYLNDKFRRFYNYGIECNFRGDFSKYIPVDKNEYLEKKSMMEEDDRMTDREFAEECLKRGMSVQQILKHVGISKSTVYDMASKVPSSNMY